MACPSREERASRPAPNQVVQIDIASRAIRDAQKVKRPEPTPIKIGDFHCGKCGLTLHRRPETYAHLCPGKRQPIEYQERRQRKCDLCIYNEQGVCVEYKRLHQERDCVIEIGIQMPNARCPIGEWEKTLEACPSCKKLIFDEAGIRHCRYCGWSKNDLSRVQNGWAFIPKVEEEFQPSKDFAIVTLVFGEEARQQAQWTLPAMRRYAERCGADLVVLEDDRSPEYVLGNKFRTRSIAQAYQRTLFLDADVFLRAATPNLFEVLPAGRIHVHQDRPFIRNSSWLEYEAAALSQSQQVPLQRLLCLNTGVLLCDREHSELWTPPGKPFRATHTSEQSWVEYEILQRGFPVSFLDTKYNTQWWFPEFEELSDKADIIHLASCPHEERLFLLKLLEAGELKLPKSPRFNTS